MVTSLVMLLLFACTPVKEEVTPSIEISSASFDTNAINPLIVFPAEGGAAYIDFNAQESWTVTTDVGWCTLSLSAGNPGRIHLQLIATANDQEKERRGRLVIAAPNASSVVSLTLLPLHSGLVE